MEKGNDVVLSNRNLAKRFIWNLSGSLLGGMFGGGFASLLPKAFSINAPQDILFGLGFFGMGMLVVLRQFGVSLPFGYQRPKTEKEILMQLTELRRERKNQKVFAAIETPQTQIVENVTEWINLPDRGMGHKVEFGKEYSLKELHRIFFYLQYWPGNPSQHFLKTETKLMSTDDQVEKFQKFLLRHDLVIRSEKGREGHRGYEFTEKGMDYKRGMALRYNPSPQEKDVMKNRFKRFGVLG